MAHDVGKDEETVFFQYLDVGEQGSAMPIDIDAETTCATTRQKDGTDADAVLVAVENLKSLGRTANSGENRVETNGVGFETEPRTGA